MGALISWICIPKRKEEKGILEFLKQNFDPDIQEVTQAENSFSLRDKTSFKYFETADFEIVSNLPLALALMEENNQDLIQRIYLHFKKPQQILVTIQDDGYSTIGYGVIENGRLVRTLISIESGPIKEYGKPLSFEKNWLEGDKVSNYSEEEVIDLGTIKNSKSKEEIHIYDLPSTLNSEANRLFLGSDWWDIEEEGSNYRYFTVSKKTKFDTVESNSNQFKTKSIYLYVLGLILIALILYLLL